MAWNKEKNVFGGVVMMPFDETKDTINNFKTR